MTAAAGTLPPASRDGLGPSCVVTPASGPWATVLDFLDYRFPAVGRAQWQARMESGSVLTNAHRPLTVDAPFRGEERIYYFRSIASEPAISFEAQVLWRDEHLLVADKPHFLPVLPSGRYVHETLLVRLKKQYRLESLVPIHRIDRDTAGLVLFSVNPASRNSWHALFREHRVEKVYHAVAPWNPELQWPLTRQSRIKPSALFIQQTELPGPCNAVTHIQPLEVQGRHALYELRPVTGQRHQLRVHMAALGLPLVGDGIYPVLQPEGEVNHAKPLQLVAKYLSFTNPVTGLIQHFESRHRLQWKPICT